MKMKNPVSRARRWSRSETQEETSFILDTLAGKLPLDSFNGKWDVFSRYARMQAGQAKHSGFNDLANVIQAASNRAARKATKKNPVFTADEHKALRASGRAVGRVGAKAAKATGRAAWRGTKYLGRATLRGTKYLGRAARRRIHHWTRERATNPKHVEDLKRAREALAKSRELLAQRKRAYAASLHNRRKNPNLGFVVKARKGTGGTAVFQWDGRHLSVAAKPVIYPTESAAVMAGRALYDLFPKLHGRDWRLWAAPYGSLAVP